MDLLQETGQKQEEVHRSWPPQPMHPGPSLKLDTTHIQRSVRWLSHERNVLRSTDSVAVVPAERVDIPAVANKV